MKITIRANVVDISSDSPNPDDQFLIDTNVWYWMVYERASLNPNPPQAYQLDHYPAYLSKALEQQAAIFWSSLSLAELAHNIEGTERQIYSDTAGRPISVKEFRHDYPQNRMRINNLIRDCWHQVKGFGGCAPTLLDEATTDASMSTFLNAQVDGYDLFIITAMQSSNITNVITDDGDYASVAGLTVFTANPTVIRLAKAANRLRTR
ncbi:hypothetical protein EOS_16730 [Caballeronia mineralivorans PML1(12)]|uniref:Uncharacterized protein n=1 Tax=Caballeronia mineralivorans PML1(12) TaxID=908627 RepID=A0A0J1FYQ7_9BURK|nr:PIN domain-containing protein [Caballeronia mineralivorans]KLU25078.1 hypothetical protein EOS_16730 [Caballeronia mineralivorans PML1(12)]